MSSRRWDPNPTRGDATLSDKTKAALSILIELPIVLTKVLLRRLFLGSTLPFSVDFRRSFFRSGTYYVPLSIKRRILTPRDIPDITSSNRFKHVSGTLFEEVLEENLAGFWICRGLKRTLNPRECDLVVLYIHGGAFVIGHPLTAAVSQLRIAEIAEQHGLTVAIFSVNYTLAPEAKFPVQRNQVLSAYRYLIQTMHVDPSRIVVSGQSAGGYLGLSLFEILGSEQLPKPGAAWLLYPWLDLANSGASFQRNLYNDTLNKQNLDAAAHSFLGGSLSATVDFSRLDNLSSILPQYTWVTVGTHDVFVDSNQTFVNNARKDGTDIDIVTHEGRSHAWDAVLDYPDKTAYISLSPDDDTGGLMKGAELVAQGLLQIYKKLLPQKTKQ